MVRQVSYRDFQAFVDEKGLERPCVECGTNDWQMLGGDDDPIDRQKASMFLASLPELVDNWKPERTFATYVMYCGGCGAIKLVAGTVVWDWLEKRDG